MIHFSSTLKLFKLHSLLFLILLAACEAEPVENEFQVLDQKASVSAEKENTFYGPAAPFGKGVVRAMVIMNHENEPISIGVKISEKVVQDLPPDPEVLTLRLPNKAEGLAFDHIDLDWNPGGHEPAFYEVPHFDVHFYMVSEDYRNEIVDPVEAANLPDAQYIPENYFLPAPDLVPRMGVHWLSLSAPELGGSDFTHTFIYGSYDGAFIFYEPMITLDYLENEADGTLFPIAQPQEFQRKGYYYPTTYSMDFDAVKKEYTISMSGMVLR